MDRTAFQLITRGQLRFACAAVGVLFGFGAAALVAEHWFGWVLAIFAVALGAYGSDRWYFQRRMKRGY
jgi:hypothetical protein